jgi:hypothetical protein
LILELIADSTVCRAHISRINTGDGSGVTEIKPEDRDVAYQTGLRVRL